jgi:hypothetical protein
VLFRVPRQGRDRLLAEMLADSTPPVRATAPVTGTTTGAAPVSGTTGAAPVSGATGAAPVRGAEPALHRPGRVELLPAVPRYLPAGRVTGLRTRAGVVVGLAWDRPAGRASVLLHSGRDQQVDVVCRGAREFGAAPLCRKSRSTNGGCG